MQQGVANVPGCRVAPAGEAALRPVGRTRQPVARVRPQAHGQAVPACAAGTAAALAKGSVHRGLQGGAAPLPARLPARYGRVGTCEVDVRVVALTLSHSRHLVAQRHAFAEALHQPGALQVETAARVLVQLPAVELLQVELGGAAVQVLGRAAGGGLAPFERVLAEAPAAGRQLQRQDEDTRRCRGSQHIFQLTSQIEPRLPG